MIADKKISIVIPTYNEEQRISSTLDTIIAYFNKSNSINYEIIVVDDGSSDNTVKLVRDDFSVIKVIEQVKNYGKGAAVKRGLSIANGDIIVFSDADLSTPIYELEKLLRYFDAGYDIVIGSRALNNDLIKEHQPFYREAMGKTFNKIVQALVIKGIQDTQCGFKGFTKHALDTILPKAQINGFSFDVELLFLAQQNDLKVKEVAVEWYNDERSKVSPIIDPIKMLLEILKIRRLHK